MRIRLGASMTDEYVRGENEEGESASFELCVRLSLDRPFLGQSVGLGGVGVGGGQVWYGMVWAFMGVRKNGERYYLFED